VRVLARRGETGEGYATMKRKIGDRRAKPRFEIVGDLWGAVDTSTSLRLANVGRGGALLFSPFPLTIGSVHWVTAVTGDRTNAVQLRVRHSEASRSTDGAVRYQIGVEFLQISPVLEETIVRQVELEPDSGSVEVMP
jgi:hypothetical protein